MLFFCFLRSGGKLSFPDFLKVMHTHSKAEDIPKEVVDAFKAADTTKSGTVPAKYLKHVLVNWGEGLSSKEGKRKPQIKVETDGTPEN
jgi:Ca2+-binding protein (EF-Hand superfamily)